MISIVIVSAVGLLCSILLVVASHFLAVSVDKRAEDIRAALPGANCGACGYAGCDDYAKALSNGEAAANLCVPGGNDVSKAISDYLGIAAEVSVPQKAVVRCNGTANQCGIKYIYTGPKSCSACTSYQKGNKSCSFGCVGFGDCVKVCKFGALSVVNGVAVVDDELCTGCGACANECPQKLIAVVPASSKVAVRCSSLDKGQTVKANCASGCIGCMLCTKACPTEAITVTNNLASINPELCTNCGACAEKCPVKVITIA